MTYQQGLRHADCCDGSDESSGKCSNTCAQAGAAARAELKAKAAREAAGAKVKEGYVQKAQEDKQRWQAEAAKLSQEIAQQQKLVDQWKGECAAPCTPMPAFQSFMQCMLCYSASAVILAPHAMHRVHQGNVSQVLCLPAASGKSALCLDAGHMFCHQAVRIRR